MTPLFIKTDQNKDLKKIRPPLKRNFANNVAVPSYKAFSHVSVMRFHTSAELNATIKGFLEPRGCKTQYCHLLALFYFHCYEPVIISDNSPFFP